MLLFDPEIIVVVVVVVVEEPGVMTVFVVDPGKNYLPFTKKYIYPLSFINGPSAPAGINPKALPKLVLVVPDVPKFVVEVPLVVEVVPVLPDIPLVPVVPVPKLVVDVEVVGTVV